jgi:hypothetical protein
MAELPIRHRRIKIAAAIAALAAFAFVLSGWSAPVAALEEPTIMKVQETWELVVASANPASGGPQLNTVMSPMPHVDNYYGLFTINYIDLPGPTALGGMEAQLWKGNVALHYDPHREGIPLQYTNETVTWQQTLQLAGGWLSFHVHDGNSTSWGTFGELDYCLAQYPVEDLANLNGYTPDVSVDYTRRWGLERDRITSLRITRIQKWDNLGNLVNDDTTSIPVLPN